MKSSLPILISVLLLLCFRFNGDLKANTDANTCLETIECQDLSENLCAEDNPCYGPDWHYTYGITHNSATFEWEAVYGAHYYTIQWRYPGGSWYNITGYCYQNWYNMGDLSPCTSYEWRVRAHCGYGYYSNWCYPVNFTTHCNYCYPPQWLQCYDITDHSATWKWDDVDGSDYYHIQWRYPGGYWYDLDGGPFYGTWVNVYHLNPCTTYEWRVRSYCYYGGWSNYCYPYTFTTHCESSCPAPTGLMTKDIGDTKATFKWNPVYGAKNYTVQIRDSHGYWHDVAGSPTSGIWITAYYLTPCKYYEWRVKANCHYYSSSHWSYKSFTTTCGHGCYAPEWTYTNGTTSSSAILHWTSVIGADYYVVELRTAGGTWYEAPGGPFTNTLAEISGLQSNTTYEWRVKAHCHTGFFSGWSAVNQFTTSGASCGMPLFRYTNPITESTATFNWSAVSGAINYTVQIRLQNGTWADVPGSPTTSTSLTASGLLPDTMYEWRMKVNCSNGASSPWMNAMFRTGSTSGCGTPAGLNADNVTLSSALLSWTSVPGAVYYSVEMRGLPSGLWLPVPGSPVTTNSIVVDSLAAFTTYEFRVRATCAGDVHSFWSGAAQFTTTDLPPCPSPGGLVVDSIADHSALLHWSPVAGVQGYLVELRFPNGIWVEIGGLEPDTSLLATGLTANTTYEFRVRSKCGDNHHSNWSTPLSFVTTGSGMTNNDCANATWLTVGSECVTTFASNIDATASAPAPMGGCPSNGYKDVWFRFTMPDVQNPAVTIRTGAGSLANAVMEVYSGTDCGFQSIIACEDNNDNGNGSMMPVINLTGTPNANIWVRVWGLDGSTGTFTICVFNYISFNNAEVVDTYDPAEGSPIVELEEVVPVNIESNSRSEIHISPNPVSDILNVEVLQTDAVRVVGLRMMDLSGKVILTQDVEPITGDQFRTRVDVSNVLPGIYLLQVQTTQGMMLEKVSVIR